MSGVTRPNAARKPHAKQKKTRASMPDERRDARVFLELET